MDASSILRIVGGVAGIGGLGLGVFLLVARAVLKAVPPPTKVPSTSFFKTIDRIILFAFILGLVGIVVYAFLEMSRAAQAALKDNSEVRARLASLDEKHKTLSDQYKDLDDKRKDLEERIVKIEDPGLKARSAALEVLSADITFDLTNWKQVPEDEIRVKKRSFNLTKSRRVISRAHVETVKFAITYGTDSAFEPDFSCKTHVMTPIPNNDRIQTGKETLRRWILEYDISKEPLFKPFPIDTEVVGWNMLQNPSREHEGTLILFPTRKASLEVLFPEQKKPLDKSIECFSYPLSEGGSPVPVQDPKLTLAADRSRVKWEIEQPRLGYHYEVHWKW